MTLLEFSEAVAGLTLDCPMIVYISALLGVSTVLSIFLIFDSLW